jgi:hypothetical protein
MNLTPEQEAAIAQRYQWSLTALELVKSGMDPKNSTAYRLESLREVVRLYGRLTESLAADTDASDDTAVFTLGLWAISLDRAKKRIAELTTTQEVA